MTIAPKPKKDSFVDHLEKQIRKALRESDLKQADRIKLIEAGAKLAAIRHKVEEGGGGAGSFFQK